ncbi:MAG: hypothetical protein Q4C96_01125 [Planctomycetia bacterium]|nr:hypothetical protein [Planctomycetia bacterium]
MNTRYKNYYCAALWVIFGILLCSTGCQHYGSHAHQDPLLGKTRLPAPQTTRRAVFVRNNDPSQGNVVIPGSLRLSMPPVSSQQNPGVIISPPPPSAPTSYMPPSVTPSENMTSSTRSSTSRGGWVPVSPLPLNQDYDLNAPHSVARGQTAEPYITRYTPEDTVSNTQNLSECNELPHPKYSGQLQWIPVSPRISSAVTLPKKDTVSPAVPAQKNVPGGILGTSYSQRFPYSKIIPGRNSGILIPRNGFQEYPRVNTPPSTSEKKHLPEDTLCKSNTWVHTLEGPFIQEIAPAVNEEDDYQQRKKQKIAIYFGNHPSETQNTETPPLQKMNTDFHFSGTSEEKNNNWKTVTPLNSLPQK